MPDYSNIITEIAAIPTISSGNFLDNSGENVELNLNIRKYCGNLSKKRIMCGGRELVCL